MARSKESITSDIELCEQEIKKLEEEINGEKNDAVCKAEAKIEQIKKMYTSIHPNDSNREKKLLDVIEQGKQAEQALNKIMNEMIEKVESRKLKFTQLQTKMTDLQKVALITINKGAITMTKRDQLQKLADQGDFDALFDLCDELHNQGNFEDKLYGFELAANQRSKQTDPKKLNQCLYAMRNLGIMLACVEEGNEIVSKFSNPQKAFSLYQEIVDSYPNERQAMFTRCELGRMYYDEGYKKFGIPHDPDQGMVLIKKWAEECSKEQGLETVPMLCLNAGVTISAGRYYISRENKDQGLNKEDLEFAQELLKKVGNDAGQIYDNAQKLLRVIENLSFPTLRRAEIAGVWEWRVDLPSTIWSQPRSTFQRFEFFMDAMYRYTSSQGADAKAGYEIIGNEIKLGAASANVKLTIEDDNKMLLRIRGAEDTILTRI